MPHQLDLAILLASAVVASVLWGRIGRTAYSRAITSVLRFAMRYSRTNGEVIHSYLMWILYLAVGLIMSVVLLVAYQVNVLDFFGLESRYLPVIALTFIAQNALTGLAMGVALVVRPFDVFSELTSIDWIKYTLMMRRTMRAVAPLCTAAVEELFFRGTVFLILIRKFPEIGAYWPIVVCTSLFVLQQILQTDTLGQCTIFVVGSTSISVVGCLAMLYTGSFLPAFVCHVAYAALYLQMGTAGSRGGLRKQRPAPAYSGF